MEKYLFIYPDMLIEPWMARTEESKTYRPEPPVNGDETDLDTNVWLSTNKSLATAFQKCLRILKR